MGSTNSKKLTVTHDVIYAKDDLYSASPKTSSSGPYTVSFAYPWGFEWSFTYDGNPNISVTENTSADTAKWIIAPGFLKNLQGSDRLELGSSWKANPASTYTGVQVSHVSEWHSAIDRFK